MTAFEAKCICVSS